MIIPYHKLVRDKIPQIIKKRGGTVVARTLNEDDYIYYLKLKLKEEVDELIKSEDKQNTLYEIVDILELMDYIVKSEKVTEKAIKSIKAKKRKERGGFDKKIFMVLAEE
jgi:predicted house-cleaning noncanonical NTP pyrophosphatase (MazG superfamily)